MTFQDALQRQGVSFRVGQKPNEIKLCCLFCTDKGETVDTRFRLNVNARSGKGYCFNCGWKSKSTAPYWILRKLRIDPAGVRVAAPDPDARTTEAPALPRDFIRLCCPVDDLDQIALNYLLQRGITRRQIRVHDIGVSYTGRYAYRIIFPVMDGDELRGIVARDFTGHHEPRYLNSLGDKWLWGFDPEAKSVILAEGIIKALRLERACPAFNCAATLGYALSERQLMQLGEARCRDVVLYPDPDRAGRRGVLALADRLVELGKHVSIVFPVAKPADEERLAVMQDQVATAIPYSWAARIKIQLY